MMDSRAVNTVIRHTIRPLLSDAGFNRFTARTAWRHVDSRIEVLNFQSFNSYLASGLDCTTYSFCVNLGSYLLEVPEPRAGHLKSKDGQLLPAEYNCHLRGRLSRGFAQRELDRRDIWYVDPEGTYLDEAIQDVRSAIIEVAFPWYENLRNSERVLQILMYEPEHMDQLWGFGNNPSPCRSRLIGYVALNLGRMEIAIKGFEEALASGCFKHEERQIASALRKCRRTRSCT